MQYTDREEWCTDPDELAVGVDHQRRATIQGLCIFWIQEECLTPPPLAPNYGVTMKIDAYF